MWTRKQLKETAKKVLHDSYFKCLLVSIILILISDGVIGGSFHTRFQLNINGHMQTFEMGLPLLLSWLMSQIAYGLLWVTHDIYLRGLMILIIYLFIVVLIIGPLQVGKARYYLRNAFQRSSYRDIFSVFTDGNYWNVVKIIFIRDIKIFLWLLCLIFPGFYKSYEYYMIPYLLAEDGSLSRKEVFARSRAMTDDQKFNIFVLNLSFIGWYLLGACLFGIGQYFVDPYRSATDVELYLALQTPAGQDNMSYYQDQTQYQYHNSQM